MLVFTAVNSSAQEDKDKEKQIPATTETKASVTIDGQRINYTVKAGYLTLKDEEGNDQANIFYMAYTKNDVSNAAKRPLTFAFNGGPGSSSVWLHLGVLGPKRVKMTPEGENYPPPYQLVENEYSWLGETDLVFIDPVSTGFSRAAEKEKANDYHGYEGDIKSVGHFIRRYLSDNKRWSSPKFVIGESYGTTRASGLCNHLINKYGLYLNGIILVSAITNFQTAYFTEGNDLPNILFLPSYTATAWYHKKLEQRLLDMSLDDLLKEVEDFAMNDYALALLQGDLLTEDRKAGIVKKLAFYTGLSEQYVERANLRINIHKFRKEVVRDEEQSVGRFDSRYIDEDLDPNGEYGEKDPSYQPTIQGPFSTCINDYLTRELGFETHLPYEVLTGRVWPWDYKPFQNRFVNTAAYLKDAMLKNPEMKVWVANGYYDLATPYFATEYTIHHMGLSERLKKNISMTYYNAGHMMYLELASLKQMLDEAKAFYD